VLLSVAGGQEADFIFNSRRPNKKNRIAPAVLSIEKFMIEKLYFEALLR
jgi:hypothetical protein